MVETLCAMVKGPLPGEGSMMRARLRLFVLAALALVAILLSASAPATTAEERSHCGVPTGDPKELPCAEGDGVVTFEFTLEFVRVDGSAVSSPVLSR